MEDKKHWKPLPFKFNHAWLKDEGFIEFAKSMWIPFNKESNNRDSKHLLFNLKILKDSFRKWEKEKLK